MRKRSSSRSCACHNGLSGDGIRRFLFLCARSLVVVVVVGVVVVRAALVLVLALVCPKLLGFRTPMAVSLAIWSASSLSQRALTFVIQLRSTGFCWPGSLPCS